MQIGWTKHQKYLKNIKTRRPASTGIFFAQLQIFWSTFANGYKQNYCFDISFQRVLTNINSTTDFCTLCKRVSPFSVEKLSSHSAEKFCRGNRLCFRKFRVSKNFLPKRGISRFSIQNFLSHSAEKFRRRTGNPSLFHNISGREGGREGGSITNFSKSFLSHSAENFRKGTLLCCVSEKFP